MKTERYVNTILDQYFESVSPLHGRHQVYNHVKRYLDHFLGSNAYGETDGAQHFKDTCQYKYLNTFCGDQEKQEMLVANGARLFRLDQEWVYKNKNSPWMTNVIYSICLSTIDAAPKTLVVLDIHKDKYHAHIRHWRRCHPNSKVKIVFLENCRRTATPRQRHDIRNYFETST